MQGSGRRFFYQLSGKRNSVRYRDVVQPRFLYRLFGLPRSHANQAGTVANFRQAIELAVRKRNKGALKPIQKRLEVEEVKSATEEVLARILGRRHIVLRSSTRVVNVNSRK